MYSKELETLINAVLADGVITDKERAVIQKKAAQEGVDADEIDVYIDGLLYKRSQTPVEQVAGQPEGQEPPRRIGYKKYLVMMLLCVLAIVASNILITPKSLESLLLGHARQVDKGEILGMFQSQAQLATTKVKIRRMGVMDPDAEEVKLLKPSTWKIGERGCIVPVDIEIEYGIELNEMDESDISLEADNVVRITLPEAKIINSNYEPETNPSDVVSISTGLRDEVGEHTIQEIKRKAYEDVLNDTTLLPRLKQEVNTNAKAVFRSMLKGMGLTPEFSK